LGPLYPELTGRVSSVGRPRRHGARFACADPAGRPAPDAALSTRDPRYGDVRVEAWHGLHPRLQGRGRWAGADAPPSARGSVIHVAVEHLPKKTARAKKTLWLWWSGPGTPDIDVCWRAYLRRFDIEHHVPLRQAGLRLDRSGPAHPRAGRPLDLAHRRGLHPAAARPRPRRRRPPAVGTPCDPARLTPTRVRRGFRRLRVQPLTDAQAADLLEVIEDRAGLRSTIVTSQLPVALWHEGFGEPTVADAICDRLLAGAHRIELTGASLRRSEPRTASGTPASDAPATRR